LYNLTDRGRLVAGAHADIVVFDAATVDAGPIEWRDDLPAGAGRLYAEPVGIAHVLVNGVEVVGGGELRAARPGTVLRRGRDLTTTR
jgi:N-acyl-D-aspartate/D-glutamate deacylase